MNLNELETLIPQYAQNKADLDSYKKICDEENKKIKAIMENFALQHCEACGYKATYTVQKRESMNEEMLLQIAHKYGIHEIIKTKEYIDFDALENAIYNGRITQNVLSAMDKAKETKEVVTLRVSKIKKKETDNE